MTSERAYARLLLIYPRAFRREYGAQMLATFRTMRRESTAGRWAFWAFIADDLLRSGLRARAAAALGAKPCSVPWTRIARGAAGAAVTALAANLIAWTFNYLYHPYLEGVTIPAWIYGALLGLGPAAAQTTGIERPRPRVWSRIMVSGLAGAVGLQVAAASTGPALYGAVLGVFVGLALWLARGASTAHVDRGLVISVAAVALAAASSAGAVHGTLGGLDPLSTSPAPMAPSAVIAWIAQTIQGDALPRLAIIVSCALASAAFAGEKSHPKRCICAGVSFWRRPAPWSRP
jgi:hypothetical protein